MRFQNIGLYKEEEEEDEKKEESKALKIENKVSRRASIVQQKELSETFKASHYVRWAQSLTKIIDEQGEEKYYGLNELNGQHLFDLRLTADETKKNKTRFHDEPADEYYGRSQINWRFQQMDIAHC